MTDKTRRPAIPIGVALTDQAVVARFWQKVSKGQPSECWIWTAAQSGDGYGRFYAGGRLHNAHRVSVLLAGQDIPDGMVVDHLCRNRLCVNPSHLRVVTNEDNLKAEGSLAAARIASEKTHCKRGHALNGDNLRISSKGRRRCLACHAILTSEYYRRQKELGQYKGHPRSERPWRKYSSITAIRKVSCATS